MTQWQIRKAVGDAHELRVAEALRARGWTSHLCRQGTYPTSILDTFIKPAPPSGSSPTSSQAAGRK